MKKYLVGIIFVFGGSFFMAYSCDAIYEATSAQVIVANLRDQTQNVTTLIMANHTITDTGGPVGSLAGVHVTFADNQGDVSCNSGQGNQNGFSCNVNENMFGKVVRVANIRVETRVVYHPQPGQTSYMTFHRDSGPLGGIIQVRDITPPSIELNAVSPQSIDVTQDSGEVLISVSGVDYGSGAHTIHRHLTSPSSEVVNADMGGHIILPKGSELGAWKIGAIVQNGAGSSITNNNLGTLTVIDESGPRRNNLSPSNDVELKDNTGIVELSLTTDEKSECHYGTSKDTNFDEMISFEKTNAKEHSSKINIELEKQYKFYIKCEDDEGNVNGGDEVISFKTVKDYEDGDVAVEKPALTLKGKLKNFKLSKRAKLYSKRKEIKFGGQADKDLIGGKVIIKGRRGSHKVKDETDIDVDGNWKEKVKFDKNGTWKVKFEFYDKYGDRVDTIGSYKITVDNEDPEFVGLKDKYFVKAGQSISLTAYDDYKLKKFKVYFRGKKHKIKPPHHKKKSSTSVAFVIPSDTPVGTYDMEVRAYDKSYNKVVRHVQVVVQ